MKIGHIGLDQRGFPTAPSQSFCQKIERRPIQIDAGHSVSAPRHFGCQPA